MGSDKVKKQLDKVVEKMTLRRKELGISQKQLGAYCGVNRVSILRQEHKICYLRADKFMMAREYLGV